MLHFHINLVSLAVILWSGMLIIAGSVWVLSSQVRKVADLIEQHSNRTATDTRLNESARPGASARVGRAMVRRGGVERRTYRAGARNPLA
ncbi:MAG: hypothetical protein P4L84_30980 [Isosphaeraceae bacterium]|nr:hypothetical protein [Isosphaeraceae bacterium]